MAGSAGVTGHGRHNVRLGPGQGPGSCLESVMASRTIGGSSDTGVCERSWKPAGRFVAG